MMTSEIERQQESIIEHLDQADHGKYPNGNLIIAINKLVDINHSLVKIIDDLVARVEHLEDVLQAELERPRRS